MTDDRAVRLALDVGHLTRALAEAEAERDALRTEVEASRAANRLLTATVARVEALADMWDDDPDHRNRDRSKPARSHSL